jgi:ATP-dependent helicase/nuclease subunit A
MGAADLLARDREARSLAQARFDRPLVLEAGAGTGKTTTLIARLLSWCLGAGWEKALRSAPPRSAPSASTGGGAAGGQVAAVETPAGAGAAAEAAAGPRASSSASASEQAEGEAVAAPAGPGAAAEATAAWVLRRVVALTFTEAAAAEMAERAARELLALARGGAAPEWLAAAGLPPPAELAQRSRALLSTLDHLAVGTIHAYCLSLLAAHPMEAGVHPRLQVDADGRLLQQVIAETVEAALRPGYGAPGDPHLLALAVLGCGPREVAGALAALIDAGIPAAALLADPFAGGGWRQLRCRVALACTGLQGALAPLAGSGLRNAGAILDAVAALGRAAEGREGGGPSGAGNEAAGNLAAGLDSAGRANASAAESPAADVAAEVAALRQRAAAELLPNLRHHLREWSRGRFGKQERSRLGEACGELAVRAAALDRLLDHLGALDPERLRHGRLALAPLLAAVEDELRRRGIATFDALLLGARRLLAAHPEVRAKLRRGIDQLLVDEFQDTDATQCEVLRWIALEGPADERPGLFLVGDPKQSIYGWRSADLRAYEGFVARVRQASGLVLPLVENFRSVPAVLAEVARVVAPVMSERPGVQPAFAPLLACERRRADPGFNRGGRTPVEHWVSWLPPAPPPVPSPPAPFGPLPAPRIPLAADAATLEAEAIAADLLDLHRRQAVPWRDAAILLRGTGDLDTYLEALRRAAIPFAVGRDKQYYRRREVIEAAALVRAVLDPGDHLALVTVLRSPVVGVPDAALLPLWRHQLPRLLTELHRPSARRLAAVRQAVEAAARELPKGVPGLDRVAGWELALLAAVEQLALLRESFAHEPADRFVERLRRLLLVDVTAAARHLGAYRLANLERFFRQLLVEIEDGSGDVAAVLRALRESVAAGREAEEGRPPESAEDAVQVVTIHGAKGLDFAHVYLPQLHKPAGGERPATAAGRPPAPGAAEAEGWEYRLLGAATPGFDLAEERRLEVEAAERVRTLYVAMTRAKDRLVLAGAWPCEPADPPPPEQARTHLQLLAWRSGCPDLRQLWREAAAAAAAITPAVAGGAAPEIVDGATLGLAGDAEPGVRWRFPALAPLPPAPAPEGSPEAELATPAEVAAQAARLADGRDRAAARMARPFGAAASEEAHAQLREELAASRVRAAAGVTAAGEERRPPRSPAVAAREVALAAGAALHRALELWDLDSDPAREVERQRALLPAYLAAVAGGEVLERALPRCRELLERFAAAGLAARLQGLAGGVLARELPVLLAPQPEAAGGGGPVGFVSGAVDLLYRDPATGEPVIADYKTDEVAGAELERRAAVYASQGAAYSRAVQEALDLAAPPRFELWFVHAGAVRASG